MKKLNLFAILIFISAFSYSQTFEIWKGDTINITDVSSLKQGNWIYFTAESKIIESQGKYVNNMKEGLWKFYFENGILKSQITYQNNLKIGPAKVYFSNGNIAEEGIWKRNKWVGNYKSYHENGQVSYDWNYNEKGERSGVQKYYHPNGKIKIQGNWKEGKEAGVISEYYETGELKAERLFADGQSDSTSFKVFTKENNTHIDTANVADTNITNENNDNQNVGVFTGNGYHTFYNKNRKIEKEGFFQNGYLQEGKHFIYDEKGNLISTKIYKKGKVIETIKN